MMAYNVVVTEISEAAYTRAFEALGFGGWAAAVPPLETLDETVRTYALATLLVRAAGLRARTIEASMAGTWRQDHATDAACIATAVPDDDGRHERAFWEAQRLATLLTHLDIGVQGDPYLAAAAAAVNAATTLLFAPSRRPDDLEAVIDDGSRQVTAAYLDQARDALQSAPWMPLTSPATVSDLKGLPLRQRATSDALEDDGRDERSGSDRPISQRPSTSRPCSASAGVTDSARKVVIASLNAVVATRPPEGAAMEASSSAWHSGCLRG